MHAQRILILGGGAAGTAAAVAARHQDARTEVVVLEREAIAGARITQLRDALVEERGGKPFAPIAAERQELLTAPSSAFWREQGITLRTGHAAMALHLERRAVTVRAPEGDYEAPYDALILATGSRTALPDVPGVSLPGVFSLRRPADAVPLEAHLTTSGAKRAAIVGAGIPGLVLAEALLRRGLAVAVLERAGRALSDFDASFASRIAASLQGHGGQLCTNATLERIEAAHSGLRLVTSAGEHTADVVVLATGATPDVALAAKAGLSLGLSGALTVDETQHTSRPDVFAAGECAESFHALLRRRVYAPHPAAAFRQGLVAGANAAGGERACRGFVGTRSLRLFDVAVARTGLSAAALRERGREVFAVGWQRPAGAADVDIERLTLVVDRATGRLLGAEVLGAPGAERRIDVLATAVHAGLDLDSVAGLDLALSPSSSASEDPIRLAAEAALEALMDSLGPGEVVETGARPRRSASFDLEL